MSSGFHSEAMLSFPHRGDGGPQSEERGEPLKGAQAAEQGVPILPYTLIRRTTPIIKLIKPPGIRVATGLSDSKRTQDGYLFVFL